MISPGSRAPASVRGRIRGAAAFAAEARWRRAWRCRGRGGGLPIHRGGRMSAKPPATAP
jgi:hypothetical protein